MTFTVLSSEWLGFCYNLIPFQSYVMFFSFFLHANYRIWLGTFWPSHEMWVGLLLVHYILRLLLGTFLLNIVPSGPTLPRLNLKGTHFLDSYFEIIVLGRICALHCWMLHTLRGKGFDCLLTLFSKKMEHPRPLQVCTSVCIIYAAHKGRVD